MMLIRHASWIRMKDASSLVVPVFRRTFTCPGRIRTATLEVTCDGVYEALLNGSRVGSFILAPGWTQYNKRLQVQRYDITGLLQENNALEVTELCSVWNGAMLYKVWSSARDGHMRCRR